MAEATQYQTLSYFIYKSFQVTQALFNLLLLFLNQVFVNWLLGFLFIIYTGLEI